MALLSVWAIADRRVATDFLRQSAYKMWSVAATDQSGPPAAVALAADQSGPPAAVALLAGWYTHHRSEMAKALLTAESEVISAMANSLPRSLAGKSGPTAAIRRPQQGS